MIPIRPHVVIAGPGRSGTTLLVRLFDELGFETGAERLAYSDEARAGLEADLLAEDAPHVVKHPGLTALLPSMLEGGIVDPRSIEWLVVPLRTLAESAASRVKLAADLRDFHAAGTMFGTKRPRRQAAWLAGATYGLLQAAAQYEIPLVLLEYPRFAREPEYAYRRLEPMLGGRSLDDFTRAWRAVVDPALVRDHVVDVPRFAGSMIAYVRGRDWLVSKARGARRRLTRSL